MHFLYANLAWGFLLVLLPALIHLIQRLRHRRVGWAAMQFLQASYRKHQRWIWLKQLLLMALRMLAVAACVAMLAQWVTQDQWLHWFGGQTIHHVVILDDSLSMDDRSQGGATAFDRAQQALRDLVATAQRSSQPQKLTLIRASRAALSEQGRSETPNPSTPPVTNHPSLVDLQAVPIRPNMDAFREPTDEPSSSGWRVSQQAVGLVPALTLAADLLEGSAREERVIHVLSDFRQADWEQTADVVTQLTRLQRARVAIHLIRCALEPDANLSVTSLAADAGTQAAGVPLMMKVGVHNHSATTLQRVPLKIVARAYATSNAGNEAPVQETELPNLVLDQLAPGETIWRQFQVYFATPGDHVVEVTLPNDALAEDNHRWAVVSLPAVESALIIDGDGTGRAAYYLQSIFEPGSRARTGIRPIVQPVRFLRDTNVDELLRYQAIYLLDVPVLDDRSQTNLQEYLQHGGGVTTFVGPQLSAEFYTQAFERGWFPVPLAGQMEGPSARDAESTGAAADVVFGEHPMFRALFGQDNPFATAIRIRRYARTPESWTPAHDSGVEILARLRNGAPLALQRTVGKGHSVAFLTTLAPEWNNWALEPSFIVTLLQLHAYLTESQRSTTERLVGSRLELAVDSGQYKPSVSFTTPTLSVAPRNWSKIASPGSANDPQQAHVVLGPLVGQPATAEETEASGVYDAQLETLNGILHHRRFALNVSPREGALAVASTPDLKQRLMPIDVQIRSAEQGLDQVASSDTSRWSLPLLTLLLVVLLVEQWLAYLWSYHPRPLAVATGGARS